MIIQNDNYLVYIHTNKTNGKRYVGITCQKPNERWRDGKGYKHCPVFSKAIQKYGWDGFDHDIFAANLTQAEAENMEKLQIAQLHTLADEDGYNVAEGGFAPKHSEETKKKISETHLGPLNPMFGRKQTESELKQRSERMSGEGNPMYGKHHSEETKKKLSDHFTGRHVEYSPEKRKEINAKISRANMGRKRPPGGGRPPKKIRCIETGEVFDSIAEAARSKGINGKQGISRVAKGKAEHCGGYHWEYCETSSK